MGDRSVWYAPIRSSMTRCRAALTTYNVLRPVNQDQKLVVNLLLIQTGRPLARDDDHVVARRQALLIMPEKFPDLSFYPITHNGVADLFGNRYPESALGKTVGHDQNEKIAGLDPLPGSPGNRQVLPPLAEALRP